MSREWLERSLEESRVRGYIGAAPIDAQIAHSESFIKAWVTVSDSEPQSFLDLGSGGGLPGLVLLEHWASPGVLIDAMRKRTQYLQEILEEPDAPPNGLVVNGRAEELARLRRFDSAFQLVTSRSFGPPSVTAECSVRFLSIGGYLLVSEPPDQDSSKRWSSVGLEELGLELVARVHEGSGIQILKKMAETTVRYPRRNGSPSKRPLF